MKLSVTQENLNKALSIVSRVLTTKPSLPILQNIMLSTDSAKLNLVATNLEVALSYSIRAKVETEGSVTIPGRLLNELVSSLDKDTIQLIAAEHNMRVKTSNLDSLLNGMNPEDFPLIPKIKADQKIVLSSEALKYALSQVVIAAALDEARPVLNGVLFAFDKDTLTLAATDSYRLAESKLAAPGAKAISVIVPIRTATELTRLLGDEKEVTVELSSTEIVFTIGSAQLISRLIEGNYPNYTQIFPEKSTTQFMIEREELLKAVKVSALFARESANTIKLSVDKDKLSVATAMSEVGENTSEIPVKVTGEPIAIQLNSKFVISALSAITTPSVTVELTGDLNPCIIRPKSNSKESNQTIHVIMPLRS